MRRAIRKRTPQAKPSAIRTVSGGAPSVLFLLRSVMVSDTRDSDTSASGRATFPQTIGRVLRARRTRRIGVGVAVFLVAFGLLGFFAAPPLLRHVAERQLSEQLGRPATIARIALNPYSLRLEADRIHVGEPGGAGTFVDIGKLVVRPSWLSVLRGAPIVDEVKLEAPHIHIVRYDAQRFNFTDLVDKFSKPSAPSSSPTRFAVSNIQVTDGRIDFDDRLLHEQHVIDQWSLGIPFVANLRSKLDVFVTPQLRARFDGSPLAIDGKIKPFAPTRESEVALKFSGLDVPRLLSYAPTKLPVAMTSGKLSSDLNLTFSMAGYTPALRVSGTVDLAGAKFTEPGGAPLFGAQALHVAAAQLEPLRQTLHFDEIRLDRPVLEVSRDRSGALNLAKLAGAGTPAAKPAAPAAQPAADAKRSPLDLTIAHLAINDGTVHVRDAMPPQPLAVSLAHLYLKLDAFGLQGKHGAHYALATDVVPEGAAAGRQPSGALKADGTVSVASSRADTSLTLTSLPLALAAPYLTGATTARVAGGTLGASLKAQADWSKGFAAQIADSTLDLNALEIVAPQARKPAIVLPQARVVVTKIDTATQLAQIASVSATGLALDVKRLPNGDIDLASLAGGAKPAHAHSAPAPASSKGAGGWHYRIGEFALQNAQAHFTDTSTQHAADLAFAPVQLKVLNVSDDLSKPLPVTLRATLNRKGSLDLSGDVTPTPLKLRVKVDANRVDVAAFEPYFGARLNATVASALLNAKGSLDYTGQPQRAAYRGEAALADVRMIDKVTADPFGGWRTLALTGLRADYDAVHGTSVDAARVTFAHFYGRVVLSPQGRLNLKDVVNQSSDAPAKSLTRDGSGSHPVPLTPGANASAEAAEPAASALSAASAALAASSAPSKTAQSAAAGASGPSAAAAAGASGAVPQTTAGASPPVRLHFGQLVLQSGKVNYTDDFIKPNYSADLVDIAGTVGAFGTDTTTPAPVDIAANLAGNGPISIKGTVNPLIANPALDVTATAHGIELTNLTPYSAKYAGYPITKGKLNVDLHYALADNLLKANNHIFIDQLTFGPHIDNDTATHLPVQFAISLLKNSRGEIDVNIPVSGSLSDPQFSIGSLIWSAVLHLIEKAVTAPFTLLANAFGGGGEELGYVEFAPGSSALTDASKKKLDTIVGMLTQKPSIRLDLTGRVDPAVDQQGLRDADVERLVRQQKLKDVIGQGESVDPASVQVAPGEYQKYLTKAYKAADFKKPRNLIGMQKTLPPDAMKQALEAHAKADDNALRQLAQARAAAVQQYLDGKVDSSRVFIVAPKLDAQGITDKGATARVDFGLK